MVRPLFIFVVSLVCITSAAQPTIVSGKEGTLHDAVNQSNVNYTVHLSGAARMVTWNARNYCGLNWTGIECPTMGNVEEEGIVTYHFSKPIRAIDLFLCHVNMNGSVAPEVFGIKTDHGTIELEVDSGTCAPWKVLGNVLTSPSVEGGINVIVHITCDSAFTILSVQSAHNSRTGGSGTAFIENSVQLHLTSTPFTIPPSPTDTKKKPHRRKEK